MRCDRPARVAPMFSRMHLALGMGALISSINGKHNYQWITVDRIELLTLEAAGAFAAEVAVT